MFNSQIYNLTKFIHNISQMEARSVDRLQTLNKGFENKIIELQQKLTHQVPVHLYYIAIYIPLSRL